jgi:hypothetical protein
MTNNKTPHLIVALNFPKGINKTIGYSMSICQDMTGNVHFPGSVTKVALLKTRNDVLVTAETNFCLKPPTVTIEERDSALAKVKETLHSLKADVQEVANASPEDAALIIVSSGMAIKKSTSHGNQKNSVNDGKVEGTVLLKAETRGPHDWRWGIDGTVWSSKSTRSSRTKVANLIPGELYQFQNRPILTKDQEAQWSQVIKFRVR